MKKKSLLLTAVATLGLTAATMAQSNCDLINSATFTTQDSVLTLNGWTNYLGSPPPSNPIPNNQWTYVAITKNGNSGQIYFDGNLIYTGTWQSLNYVWNRLDIGAGYFTSYGSYFKGYIDEVRISNIVRTSNQISNSFNSNQPFQPDNNTTGLWHFDQTTGTSVTSTVGPNGTNNNGTWSQGRFGQSIYYNGTNAYSTYQIGIPTSQMTFEFWVKPDGPNPNGWSAISWYGLYSTGFNVYTTYQTPTYTWSTGSTGNSVTVNPTTLPYIWVTDGNCTDTIWFNSQSAKIYDTTYVTVTDTLLINKNVTGLNPPNNANTIKVFPNPASTHITIDYGNFSIMNGYQLKIENSLGQQVYQTNITQQIDYLSLSTWGGNGLYFVHIIDPQGNTIDIRKIVLQ
jgi:hypothetical protein